MKHTILAMTLLAAANVHAQYYIAQVIEMPGAVESYVSGINKSGTVVGSSLFKDDKVGAFRFANCQYTDMKSLGGTYASATAINDFGLAVGETRNSSNQFRAFSYLNGPMFHIGVDSIHRQGARAVNNNGTIVGDRNIAGSNFEAVVFNNGSAPTVLPSFGNQPATSAVGINDYGRIVAYQLLQNAVRGLIYVPNGSGSWNPMEIKKLKADADVRGLDWALMPKAINVHGAITGVAGTPPQLRAFRTEDFNQPGVNLGTLNPADPLSSSIGFAINAAGWVVGSSQKHENGRPYAFVYDGAKMRELEPMLADPIGWELHQALGINDNGEIVGHGLYNGKRVGFLLTPSAHPWASPKLCPILPQ